MTERLDLLPRHREQVEALLQEHVPDAEVWAYGSRVNGQSHDVSDLDLVLRGPNLEEINASQLADLNEAFTESDIPYLVNTHDWARLPASFHQEIKRNNVIVIKRGAKSFLSTYELRIRSDSIESGSLYRPYFPGHWDKHSLYSLAEWVNGIPFKKIQFKDGGKPVIKIAEIKNGITEQTKFTHDEFDESVYVRSGDMLFSWSGQPETSIGAFRWYGPEGWLNQHIFRVTPNPKLDYRFFYYLLEYLKPNFVEIARNKQTTGLGHVTKRDLRDLEVAVPSLQVQAAIASILGTLDDKIELNRRMGQTLEELAKALFTSWFIDFDPVQVKMESRWLPGQSLPGLSSEYYDLFPNVLVDNELNRIPEGWEICSLDDLGTFRNGLALQKYRPDVDDECPLPVIKIAQLRSGKTDSKEWASSKITPECILYDGDIVFSWSGSLMVKIWCGGVGALNQHLFKVDSKNYPKWFLYFWLKQHLNHFREIASDKATTMGHIKRQHLADAKCIVPEKDVLKAADTYWLFASKLGPG